MTVAKDFIEAFFPHPKDVVTIENDKEYQIRFSAQEFSPKDEAIIESSLHFVGPQDTLSLTINFGQADSISFYSDGTKTLSTFLEETALEYAHQLNEPISSVLLIIKDNAGEISIYDLNAFSKTLSDLTFAQGFTIFSRLFLTKNTLIFSVANLLQPFNTGSIFFAPIGSSQLLNATINRTLRIESLIAASYYTNIKEHKLTPDDFNIEIENPNYSQLNTLFKRYSVALAIIYLFDITTLNNNQLEFKINGYKSIKGNIDIKSILLNDAGEYLSIYEWVYSGGNLNDKIGLARNILSLHFESIGDIKLKGSPFESIKSSYKVYEKQNIKQYIEIRNKLSDQLLEFNNRANKVIETFASGFQKSALALISFYISAIALKVLGKGDQVHLFTIEASLLSVGFIGLCLIYFFVSRWEVKQQKIRFVNSYKNLKSRYSDLLDENDINRILSNDLDFKADSKFIDDKLSTYSFMWIVFLIILFFITIFSYSLNNLPESYLKLFNILYQIYF